MNLINKKVGNSINVFAESIEDVLNLAKNKLNAKTESFNKLDVSILSGYKLSESDILIVKKTLSAINTNIDINIGNIILIPNMNKKIHLQINID